MEIWALIFAFIIGAGDGPLWPSLVALAFVIYQLGIKGEQNEDEMEDL